MRSVTAPSLRNVRYASKAIGALDSTGRGFVCPLLTTY
jgi:hypothetical protein